MMPHASIAAANAGVVAARKAERRDSGPDAAARHLRPLGLLVVAFQVGCQADGGVESLTQLLENYDELRVTVLTQMETPKNERWRRAGATVVVWPAPFDGNGSGVARGIRRAWRYLSWNVRVASLAWREHADVVHVNDHKALWHTVAGLRLTGVPVVYNIRDTKLRISRWAALKWRAAFGLTQAQVALSGEMCEFWRRSLGIHGDRLVAVPSVVDFGRMQAVSGSERRALRERLGLPPTFVAGYVASFSEKKAQLEFIEKAGPELKRLAPAIQVWFLGDFEPETNPYAAACLHAVRRLGLESQLRFKGYAADMEHWYAALDAVVVATRHEGLARCMIESLACGTPVVSFDVCSAHETLEEGGGIVVPRGDYAGLVAALARWADAAEERAACGCLGAAVARRKFEAGDNVARYLAVYESLLRPGRRS